MAFSFTRPLHRVVAYSLTVASLCIAGSAVVGAVATQQYIAITPVANDSVSVQPGAQYDGKLTVVNQGEAPFHVKMSVAPYRVENENYEPKFTSIDGATDPSSWITLDKTDNPELAGHAVMPVNYTISVPTSIQPGGYYAAIFAEASPSGNTGGGVVATNRVGTLLYITVAGNVTQSGTVNATPIAGFTMDGALKSSLNVRNTGGVHFKATVTTDISNIFGQKLFHDEQTRQVLPQTERRFEVEWGSASPVGLYKIERRVDMLGETKLHESAWVVVVQPAAWIVLFVLVIIIVMVLRMRRTSRSKK